MVKFITSHAKNCVHTFACADVSWRHTVHDVLSLRRFCNENVSSHYNKNYNTIHSCRRWWQALVKAKQGMQHPTLGQSCCQSCLWLHLRQGRLPWRPLQSFWTMQLPRMVVASHEVSFRKSYNSSPRSLQVWLETRSTTATKRSIRRNVKVVQSRRWLSWTASGITKGNYTIAAGYHHFKLAGGWRQHSYGNHHASTWKEWGEGDRLWARDDAKDWNVNTSASTWFRDVMALSLSQLCASFFFLW